MQDGVEGVIGPIDQLVPMQTCDEDRPWEIGVVAPHVLPRRGWCVEGALCRQAALGASAHAVCTARVLRWLPWDFQTHMGRRGVRPRCTHAAKEPLSRGSGSSVSPVGSPLESGVSPAHIGPSNACPRAAPETTPLWTFVPIIKLSLSLSLSPGAPGLSREEGVKQGWSRDVGGHVPCFEHRVLWYRHYFRSQDHGERARPAARRQLRVRPQRRHEPATFWRACVAGFRVLFRGVRRLFAARN